MRILADQDVWAATLELLRREKHDVVTASQIGLNDADNSVLLAAANVQKRVLLTRDKDFGALVFTGLERYAGVVPLRIDPATIEAVHAQLLRALSERPSDELLRSFCVIEPAHYRVRSPDS